MSKNVWPIEEDKLPIALTREGAYLKQRIEESHWRAGLRRSPYDTYVHH
jgi:hypothetical protein